MHENHPPPPPETVHIINLNDVALLQNWTVRHRRHCLSSHNPQIQMTFQDIIFFLSHALTKPLMEYCYESTVRNKITGHMPNKTKSNDAYNP